MSDSFSVPPGYDSWSVPPGFAVSPMLRATIFVRDLERSLELYRDLLGLRPMYDNYWDTESINAIMGTTGRTLRAVALRSGDSVVGNLGLYQLDSQALQLESPSVTAQTTFVGDFAIVFGTAEIERLTADITRAGYLVVSPPVTLRHNPAHRVQRREMMFRDPDGVLVNLIQPGG